MSQFLSNLARRAAGLAVTPVQAPPAVPFAFEGAGEVDAEETMPGERGTPSLPDIAVAPVEPMKAQPLTSRDAPHAAATLSVDGPPELISPRSDQPSPALQRLAGPVPAPALPTRTATAAPREVQLTGVADSASLPTRPAASNLPREIHIVEPGAEPSGRNLVEPAEVSALAIDTSVQPRQDVPAAPPVAVARAEASRPSGQMPVHVRIGRIEVRDTPAAPPPATRTAPPLPRGFARYSRLRTYRSYP